MIRTFIILWDGVKLFRRVNSFQSAAAISFYAFFSLIPLLLLIASVMGFIIGKNTVVLDKAVVIVKDLFPYASDRIIGELKGLPKISKPFGWLGLLTLLYGSELVLGAMADALTETFETARKYGFVRRKIINLFVMAISIIMGLTSIMMTAVAKILSDVAPLGPALKLPYAMLESLTFKLVIPFVLVTITVTFVYKLFSGPNLSLRFAFYGSLIFTVLWETAKQFFAWYVSNFTSYNRLYGSLGTLMVFLIWIFYSANMLLFSAAIARSAYTNRGGRENVRKVRARRR
jgi:membrane protein